MHATASELDNVMLGLVVGIKGHVHSWDRGSCARGAKAKLSALATAAGKDSKGFGGRLVQDDGLCYRLRLRFFLGGRFGNSLCLWLFSRRFSLGGLLATSGSIIIRFVVNGGALSLRGYWLCGLACFFIDFCET